MPSDSSGTPTLRILHQMARSGGTVICRCLASMRGVVLLSEIHPLGLKMFDPLRQAHEWYGLLTPNDLESIRSAPLNFRAAIRLIATRCSEQGRLLVIRDWSHLDFTGVPFTRPAKRSRLVDAVAPDFTLLRHATVRHPLDQWLSLSGKPVFRQQLGPHRFLEGAARFADLADTIGFTRYEDFTRDSDAALNRICRHLEIPFDSGYRNRWADYDNMTGDVLPGRADGEIRSLPRRQADEQTVAAFKALPGYRQTLTTLGYEE